MLNKKLLAPGIMSYSGLLENSSALIDYINLNNSWIPGEAAPSRYVNRKPGEVRRSVGTFFLQPNTSGNSEVDLWSDSMYRMVGGCAKDYMSQFDVSTVSSEKSKWLQVLKYSINDEFTDHIDDVPEARRQLSGVYYFNDDYVGGEIYFKHFDLTIKPLPDTYILFPSNWVYAHAARPVTAGTKYAMVNFFE